MPRREALALLCLMAGLAPATAGPIAWEPIEPELLAETAPRLDPEADAEVIFREVSITDSHAGSTWEEHLRIKLYTDVGVEEHARFELPHGSGHQSTVLGGRTVKPDGSVVELSEDAVFRRTLVEIDDVRLGAKTFVMPAAEPGCVIDVRWQLTRSVLRNYVELEYASDIPIRRVLFRVRGANLPGIGMRAKTFNGNPEIRAGNEYTELSMSDVAPVPREPFMPPYRDVAPWTILYYYERSRSEPTDPMVYWKQLGRDDHENQERLLKPTSVVTEAAQAAVSGRPDEASKLRALAAMARRMMPSRDADGDLGVPPSPWYLSDMPLKKLLRQDEHDRTDTCVLFTALARAAGFDARLVRSPNRTLASLDPTFAHPVLLSRLAVAVRSGDEWLLADPSSDALPFGMLPWRMQGVDVHVPDANAGFFVHSPHSEPQDSPRRRKAELTLSEGGDVRGSVRLEYGGHWAGALRGRLEGEDTPDPKTVASVAGLAHDDLELKDIDVSGLGHGDDRAVVTFTVEVKGYAQATAKRLFVMPSFFAADDSPWFEAEQRTHAIHFQNAQVQLDDVTLTLPEGYGLEAADAPGNRIAEGIARHDVRLSVTKDGRKLMSRRIFALGTGGRLAFSRTDYETLKSFFDAVHAADTHVLTLRRAEDA